MVQISFKDIFAPSFWQAWNDFLNHKYNEMWFTGGRGCIDGETFITTPDKGLVKVSDFQGGRVLCVADDLQSVTESVAEKPTRYTIEDLYEVKTKGGRSILVTDEHKFLTALSPDPWRMTKELSPGTPIIVYDEDGKTQQDYVESITFRKRDYYWDFNVHGTHNYLAQGFVNHNSTKSSFVSMCIILGLIRDSQEAAVHYKMGDKKWKSYLTHAIVYRKIAADLRGSVYNQVTWSIEKLGLIDKFKFNMSPLRITYKPTGQMIDFKGLDDPLKSKSIKAPFGYYKYNWFEELDQFDGMEEIRSVKQSLRRGGHLFQGFCCYNPPELSNSWVNVSAAEDIPSRHVYHSDYRSVPREWLGDTFFQEAAELKRINERAYRHEYLGEVTGNGGSVFENIVDLEMSDAMIANFDSIHIGCDFGYARDPAFVTFSHYDRKRGDIYCFNELCETNLTNPQLAEKIKGMNPGYNYIMCDSAEPKSIQELEDCGINALGVVKSGDSRRFSYKWLQSRAHIYIDKRRCPNLFRQMLLCEYLKNKAGQFISRYPENGGDDGIDSLRYAYMEDATGAGLI